MKNLLTLFLLTIAFNNSFAQGCSDAGICAAGKSENSTNKTIKNAVELGAIYGVGEADLNYISPYLTYDKFGQIYVSPLVVSYEFNEPDFFVD